MHTEIVVTYFNAMKIFVITSDHCVQVMSAINQFLKNCFSLIFYKPYKYFTCTDL